MLAKQVARPEARPANVDAVTQRKLFGLLGLGVRGGGAIVGVQQVRDAAIRGKLAFAVVAPDVSRHSLDKIVPLLTAKRIRFIEGPSAAELGAAVGRETTAVVGVVDYKLARGIRDIVEASDSSRGREQGPGGAQ
jgi:ribosomal protein L7Ae-like RNA K-turn-binding protein